MGKKTSSKSEFKEVPGTNGMIGKVVESPGLNLKSAPVVHGETVKDLAGSKSNKGLKDFNNLKKQGLWLNEPRKVEYPLTGATNTANLAKKTRRGNGLSNTDAATRLYNLLTGEVNPKLVSEFLVQFENEIRARKLNGMKENSLLELAKRFNGIDFRARNDVGVVTKMQPVHTKSYHNCDKCNRLLPSKTFCITTFKLTKQGRDVLESYEILDWEEKENTDAPNVSRLPKARIWLCSDCAYETLENAVDLETEYMMSDSFNFDVED